MKKAILIRFVSVLFLALLLSSVISYFFMGKELLNQNISNMLNIIHVIDYSLDYDGTLQEELSTLHNDVLDKHIRVTIIDMNGDVYADTEVAGQVAKLENHFERQEIKATMDKGSGHSTRFSTTLNKWMLYVASISQDGEHIIRVSIPYKGMRDYISVIFPVLLLGTMVAFGVAAIIAARFADTVTRPLKEIADEMEKVQKEELAFHLKEYCYEELNIISNTTTKLLKEIREHIHQIENEKRIRQEFFSNASHELKTPLTTIKGYAELLDNDFVQDEETKKNFIHRILRSTENMTTLINDILMIARLEAKDAEVNFSMIRMAPMLEEVVESLGPIATEYQVHVYVECEPITVEASTKQIQELLTNLITNGIKYNKPEGSVWITVEQARGNLIIKVKDNGTGISEEDAARIFQRFYRVDKGRSKKSGGTGLGLAIVKHIVEFYEGNIELNSRLGEGSEFMIEIPMVRNFSYM